jgi:RNA polymerase sigma-70 factor (ECF subfamily)
MRAQRGDESAWREVVAIYQPLLQGWLRRFGVPPQEVEDLTQEVLALVLKGLRQFEHSGRTGSFRSWLRTLTANRAHTFWRLGKGHPLAPVTVNLEGMADQLEDVRSDLSQQWDREHDRHVIRRCLEIIAAEVTPQTLQAFRMLAVEDQAVERVAAALQMTPVAVYGAKARVMARLRKIAAELLE